MSVLVEALSLIVPRKVLDISWPGGTDAFMRRMCDEDVPSRLVCADDHLVATAFFGPDEAQVVGAQLLELGVVAVDDGRFVEMAFVDQLHGPTLACDWLEWRRHRDGYTYCWQVGTDPTALHVPANWTAEQSRRLERFDVRDEPGRCLQLGAEDGHEAWLDFHTGAVTEGLPHRTLGPRDGPVLDRAARTTPTTAHEDIVPDDSMPSPLIATVREMLDGRGYTYEEAGDDRVVLAMHDEHGTYRFLFDADDVVDYVGLVGTFGSFVPLPRRLAVAEAVVRINMRLRIGSFDLDFEDGELRFRVGMDVEGGLFTAKMADNMLGVAVTTMGRHHAPLMGVAFGGVDPARVLEES